MVLSEEFANLALITARDNRLPQKCLCEQFITPSCKRHPNACPAFSRTRHRRECMPRAQKCTSFASCTSRSAQPYQFASRPQHCQSSTARLSTTRRMQLQPTPLAFPGACALMSTTVRVAICTPLQPDLHVRAVAALAGVLSYQTRHTQWDMKDQSVEAEASSV